ncbi:MAG: aminopeptidase P family protein, partial [Solirubrobacterales bacterium]|nr:aminopeptidase P family protein [Solirubrobacterales bacterium]
MKARPERLAAVVAGRDLHALLISDLVNVRWLTGFTGTSAAAVVGEGVLRFVTDFRYLTQAADQVGTAWEREISSDLLERVAEGLPDGGEPLRLGFDDAHLTVKQHARLGELVPEGVELVAAGGILEELRAVKDAGELDAIRAAARLADEALEDVLRGGLAGRTERDVALGIEIAMRRRGAEGASFPPIVAAGAHGALPHAETRDVAIPTGTLVVVDWGAQL